MGWADLLQDPKETIDFPWVGGRSVHSRGRTWTIQGRLPREHGWYVFNVSARACTLGAAAVPSPDLLKNARVGYLVGDRMVLDDARVEPDPASIIANSERVYLIEDGLDRFVRIMAGRAFEGGPLIYISQGFPLGPEEAVVQAFLDKKESVTHIHGVTPALDAAFRMEVWQRAEAIRVRAELARLRAEAEALRVLNEKRKELAEKFGDGAKRREMAKLDFGEAAKAALAIAGAEYLDHRKSTAKGEFVVKFIVDNRRFECVCDENMRITDSGICLTDHHSGKRGDAFFTLESLPSVIRQAEREHKLVVYRHVDGQNHRPGDNDDNDDRDDDYDYDD